MEGPFSASIYLKMALRIEPTCTVEKMKYNLMWRCPKEHLPLLAILFITPQGDQTGQSTLAPESFSRPGCIRGESDFVNG